MSETPEDCTLEACWSGDGWVLAVRNKDEVIAYLKWPEQWPDKVSTTQLEKFGFEIV